MKSTFGAPSFERRGSGHDGCDTSNVRPRTPLKAEPGLYSLSAMSTLLDAANHHMSRVAPAGRRKMIEQPRSAAVAIDPPVQNRTTAAPWRCERPLGDRPGDPRPLRPWRSQVARL